MNKDNDKYDSESLDTVGVILQAGDRQTYNNNVALEVKTCSQSFCLSLWQHS